MVDTLDKDVEYQDTRMKVKKKEDHRECSEKRHI